LVSQVLLYPGVEDIVVALGGDATVRAGMWFLVAEFAAFVTFASVWGAASDAVGRRMPLAAAGAFGGAAGYLGLAAAPALGLPFAGVLLVRILGGAATIGAFSLSITALADLAGGNGRNMGAAGIAIGLGAGTPRRRRWPRSDCCSSCSRRTTSAAPGSGSATRFGGSGDSRRSRSPTRSGSSTG
jgi:MFS family permease